MPLSPCLSCTTTIEIAPRIQQRLTFRIHLTPQILPCVHVYLTLHTLQVTIHGTPKARVAMMHTTFDEGNDDAAPMFEVPATNFHEINAHVEKFINGEQSMVLQVHNLHVWVPCWHVRRAWALAVWFYVVEALGPGLVGVVLVPLLCTFFLA